MEKTELAHRFLAWPDNTVCPLAGLLLTAEPAGLCRIDFVGKEARLPEVENSQTPILAMATDQLLEYMAGRRQSFTVPLRPGGTAFQQRVWQAMMAIPYGSTRSYGEIAAGLGNIHQARAVGQAANRNNLPIIIPCHRVIGSAGKLVGFAAGLNTKEFLLELEGWPGLGNPR